MSPRTKQQNEEIRQKRMAIIKETALELFGRLGYHSTSISRIAKEAGISKGLLYNYFNGKEELLEAILMDAMDSSEVWWNEIMNNIADPYEQLKQITEMAIQMITHDLHHWRLLTSLAFQVDVLKSLEPVLMRKQEVMIAQTVDLFERLGVEDPKHEAFYYGALMDGIFLHYMNLGEQYPLQEMMNFILTRYKK